MTRLASPRTLLGLALLVGALIVRSLSTPTPLPDGSFAEAALGNSARVVRAADADSIMRWIHSAAGTTQGLAVRGVARTITDGSHCDSRRPPERWRTA